MKKLIMIPLMLWSLLVVLQSCQEAEDAGVRHTINFEKMLADFNQNRIPEQFGEILLGEATIMQADNSLLVHVHTLSQEVPTVLYELQMDQPIKDFAQMNISKAQLLWIHNILIIKDLHNGSILSMRTGDAEFPGDVNTKQPARTYVGFGLARQWYTVEQPLSGSQLRASCNCRSYVPGTPPADGDCQAGGSGASSCSLSGSGGCSVTCSSGYACCKEDNPS